MASGEGTCTHCHSMGHELTDCPVSKVTAKFTKSPLASYGDHYQDYDIPVYDAHCHIDYVFDRFRHSNSSFQDFMDSEKFPSNFKGCISSFSDISAYSSFGIWQELLEQKGVWGTFGLHPHQAKYFDQRIENKLIECLKHPKAVAVGECGLDFSFRCPSSYEEQKTAFVRQLRIAKEVGKPVVIHSREAEDIVYELLIDEDMKEWPIHVHCFTGTHLQLHQFVNQFPNMCFGFTNLVSYATATSTHEVVKSIPLERILLETDAPYFVPQSLKKDRKFSHPGNVIFVAEEIAAIKQIDIDIVLDSCRKNLRKIFNI